MAAINAITEAIIGAAIAVHRELGPGLLESTYEACLAHELTLRDLRVERPRPFTIRYRGKLIDHGYRVGYRVDLPVEDRVIVVELEAVEHLASIHKCPAPLLPQAVGLPSRTPHQLQRTLRRNGLCRLTHGPSHLTPSSRCSPRSPL